MWVFAQAPAFQLLNPGDSVFQALSDQMEQDPNLQWDYQFWHNYQRALEDYQELNGEVIPPAMIRAINIFATHILRFLSGGSFMRFFPTLIRMMRGMWNFLTICQKRVCSTATTTDGLVSQQVPWRT